ncbi:MAG: GAF domain-containing protein [Actinobacteria bacterium]|nr:GAF domain-containing protein [Actinomycetota bacterium]
MALEKEHCLALFEISKSLASARNLPAILQIIVKDATEATGGKASSVRLLDETGKILKRVAAYGLSDAYLKKDPVEVEKSPVDQEALRGEAVTITDVTTDPRWEYAEESKREKIGSVLTLGLSIRDMALGTIRLYFSQPHEFSETEIEFLRALASLGAIAIDNAQAYERTARRCADLAVLNEVAEEINQTLNLSEVIRLAVKNTAQLIGVKASSIRLLDEKTGKLMLASAHGLSEAYIKKGPVEVKKSPIDQEALQGEIVAITDVTTDPRWEYPEEAKREGIASVMAAPMFIKNKAVGVLRIYTAEPRIFLDEEKELLKAIARHTAIAIENARLYELAVRSHDELVQEIWRGLPDVWSTVTGAA